MTKNLKRIIYGFLIVLCLFLSTVLITENINLARLVKDCSLSTEVLNYRKDLMICYVLGRLATYLIPFFLLVSRIGYRIDFHLNIKSKYLKAFSYSFIIFFIIFLLKLPIRYFCGYFISHAYGLSNQSIRRWLFNNIKSFIMNDFLIALVMFLVYDLIREGSRSWWLKLSIIISFGNLLGNFIYPVVISPLYNDFKTIEDGRLKTKIESLISRAEINNVKILVVDKSKDTNTMNAYMTGLSSSRRIVIWDTTIENLEEEEIVSILAHEIGHYKENHIMKATIFASFGIFLFFFLLNIISKYIIRESNGVFGVRKISDYSVLPLFLLIASVLMALSSPIDSYYSRRQEKEADYYQMYLTNDSKSAISGMKKLNESSLSLPRRGKLYEFMYGTHPNLEDRIDYYENFKEK